MTPETIMTIGQKAIEVTMLISTPLLLASLVIGLIVSVLQAATQINDMTLSFVPKLIVLFFTMVVSGNWMITTMLDYMRQLFTDIPKYIG